ncbi:MAG: amidohydrolase family protein [Pseudomonadota bacterium]
MAPGTFLPACRGPDPAPRPAGFTPPPLSCDSHAHIIGEATRYPMVPQRSYTPPPASVESYRHMLKILGMQRGVIVQPSFYGTDNRCAREAVRQSEGRLRGIAVVGPQVEPGLLADLDADGFRGARFNLLFGGGLSFDALETVARRVAPIGWHLQVLMDIRELPAMEARIASLPCDVVFDHLGHFPATEGVDSPGFTALRRLLDNNRTWVKLSGGYRLSNLPPPYGDLRLHARCLVAQRPDRLVWGSDWPHTALQGDMPNDGSLLDTLADWVPDATQRKRILVDNPAALYGF